MTLELRHIAPYLPFQLKCVVKDYPLNLKTKAINGIQELHAVYSDGSCVFHDLVESEQGFKDIKPILRPFSDIINKIEHNGETFYPYLKLLEQNCFNVENFTEHDHKQWKEFYGTQIGKDCNIMMWCDVVKLLEWHFDVFGLIEKGTAIDINTLNQ